MPLALVANVLLFGAAAAMVWYFGHRLSGYASAVVDRTRFGAVGVGMVLLGGATSLPELATTVTAGLLGEPDLAANNLMGGVAAQVAVLAIGDAATPQALSKQVPRKPVVILSAILACMLGLVLTTMRVGDLSLGVIGLAPIIIAAAYAVTLVGVPQARAAVEKAEEPPHRVGRGLPVLTAGSAGGVLLGGLLLIYTGQGLVDQTGIGSALFGALFLAITTSLPEISTVTASVRAGRPMLAFATILGANLLQMALLLVADIAWAQGPILDALSPLSSGVALLALCLVGIYGVSAWMGRTPRLLRLGADSWVVLVVYVGGFVWLGGV